MTTFTAINLVKRPAGGPITKALFEIVEKEMPTVSEGQFLVKQNHMSLDPAMFGWMSPDTNSYIPPVELGSVMRSSGIGEIVESNHPKFKVGDRVMGMMGWQQYFLTDGQGLNKVEAPLPDEAILSVFALPGITASQGYFNVGKPKKGETIIVTGAAGSVGSIVGQLAKADGLHVIGVVGNDEKADWIVNTLGFDAAINYKSDDLDTQLAKAAPNGIDLFFENTAGPIQSLIVDRMNAHGRVMVCGLIADYSKEV
ncbi:MAG: NADPH-dependent curcumin reductase CurA, partial [Bermanella sp.]